MTSHQAQVPQIVRDYFGPDCTTREGHPIIEQEFRLSNPDRALPDLGYGRRQWVTTGYRKRVSISWLRKLRAQGVTHVALRHGSRLADFSVAELIRGGVVR